MRDEYSLGRFYIIHCTFDHLERLVRFRSIPNTKSVSIPVAYIVLWHDNYIQQMRHKDNRTAMLLLLLKPHFSSDKHNYVFQMGGRLGAYISMCASFAQSNDKSMSIDFHTEVTHKDKASYKIPPCCCQDGLEYLCAWPHSLSLRDALGKKSLMLIQFVCSPRHGDCFSYQLWAEPNEGEHGHLHQPSKVGQIFQWCRSRYRHQTSRQWSVYVMRWSGSDLCRRGTW